ncbi:hypothetical protein [Persephonella sp. KM09-Lau-8]|uniref:hypothetical protein n=1 Tax=Persephonella sp. KM09-Lau-8 TaxID=1158345 RepID=UPI001E5BBE41|nr:hypothetical protein [Persephonella sp. KM09-Lau-8]
MKKVFEEIGKHFLNIGVAIVVFAILQPIIKGKFDIKISFIFGIDISCNCSGLGYFNSCRR